MNITLWIFAVLWLLRGITKAHEQDICQTILATGVFMTIALMIVIRTHFQ
jgi:hypothetical protein